ncbi:diacylglycerol/lipid kinase family protein [Flavobacterium silvaticum]|uniref:Diacylglycerol kinase family lipid kinase n=1 Tax=Flavobacterium silvaticum TaxID=1852020 RepID=A0A972JK14_9FLAO|nr:diacylglycerol kinase family protein [Flavobacterium silvaticum]NMH28662.1 diacylglycerol kinase family lipid kinase [Flavobacterium silvaticum]
MLYLHFIVNPISGKAKHNLSATTIRNYFPRSEFRIEVDYTRHKGHAMTLVRDIVTKNPDYVIACGGDGTINEVASALVGTGIILGIVPVGSGNGLASNLNIPRSIEGSFEIIRQLEATTIDVGKVNDCFFFSNMGIGIDAQIIKKYERSGNRTLKAYVTAALSASLSYKPKKAIVKVNGDSVEIDPYLLFISNSNEMGYHMSLTPAASLSDGLLDVLIVKKIPLMQQLLLGYRVLTNRVEKFGKAQHQLVKQIEIKMPETLLIDAQIDGEFKSFKTNRLDVSVIPSALKVLV